MPPSDGQDAEGSQPLSLRLQALQFGVFVTFIGLVLTVPAVVERLPIAYFGQVAILALVAVFVLRYGPRIIFELPRRLV